MNQRQEKILKYIVQTYIQTAQPVGSKALAQYSDMGLSAATLRNEMADLEKAAYITHPHTSAGRIPTEKGYQYFIENLLDENEIKKADQEKIKKQLEAVKQDQALMIKELAKAVADLSTGAVFVGFSARNIFYTGISNLFSQPEFARQNLVFEVSKVIDHLDQTIDRIFETVDGDVTVLIGSKNPFARDCATVMTKINTSEGQGLFGILGPMRMDYSYSVPLIKYGQSVINNN